MKKLLLISLTILMMLQACMSLILLLRYQVNKNYIATYLCVNRNRPELHCEGKCHLKKTLSSHEKFLQSVVGVLSESYSTVAILEVVGFDMENTFPADDLNRRTRLRPIFYLEYHDRIFHPPCSSTEYPTSCS